jgi:hypothetical protein
MAELSALFDAPTPSPKRVRFAPYVQVYSDIPWPHGPPPVEDTPSLSNPFPIQSSLKESVSHLRLEIRGDEPTSLFAIAVLVVCLFVLFLLIGFIANKILLLEVDSELGKQANSRRFS